MQLIIVSRMLRGKSGVEEERKRTKWRQTLRQTDGDRQTDRQTDTDRQRGREELSSNLYEEEISVLLSGTEAISNQ